MKTHALPTSTSPCHRSEQSCGDSYQSLVVPGQHTVLPGGHQRPAPQNGNTQESCFSLLIIIDTESVCLVGPKHGVRR